jgi:6,7-dimethyl-8-ribityllumazine synthase
MNQTPRCETFPTIATVSAGWHGELVSIAREAFTQALLRHGWPPTALHHEQVPGALEIPLAAQRLLRSGQADAVVALALVVDGGIYRHEFVAAAVINGLMRVMLDESRPVFSVVLTPQAFHEHDEHRRFFAQHLRSKGEEAAAACIGVLRPSLARAA